MEMPSPSNTRAPMRSRVTSPALASALLVASSRSFSSLFPLFALLSPLALPRERSGSEVQVQCVFKCSVLLLRCGVLWCLVVACCVLLCRVVEVWCLVVSCVWTGRGAQRLGEVLKDWVRCSCFSVLLKQVDTHHTTCRGALVSSCSHSCVCPCCGGLMGCAWACAYRSARSHTQGTSGTAQGQKRYRSGAGRSR